MSKKLFIGLAVVALVLGVSATTVEAVTAEELMAQIQALQNELAGLTGGAGGSAACTFTRSLTMGSSGADVTCLQNYLIGAGFSIPAGATGYFGSQTQAAVAAWQTANMVSPAQGYFGPISQAKFAMVAGGGGGGGGMVPGCDGRTTGFSTTTGMPCSGGSNLPAGCTSTAGYSPTTGVKCDSNVGDDDDGDTDGGDLQGDSGSVDEYTLIASLTGEQVGEAEEDVQVAGLEITADDGSDLEITAVRVVFDEGTAASDFEDYASEVSVWLDDEEVGRVDADDFNSRNEWTKTISLDGAVIEAGATADLVLAVSGISNLDTNDAGDTWTIDFRSVRFEDATGATISEDPTTATRTFSFEAFASAATVELRIKEDDGDINDPHVVNLDADADGNTEDVELASFTLEAKGDSDLEIRDFGVNLDVTGAAHVDDVIAGGTSPAIFLEIEGERYGTADYFDDGDDTDVGTDEDVHWGDVDYTIPAGDTVSVKVVADLLDLGSDLDEGDTVQVTLGETETDQTTLVIVRDESNTSIGDGDITGSVTAGAHGLYDTGVFVTFVSSDETPHVDDGSDDDSGDFKIKYRVEAFDGDVYVGTTVAPTTASTMDYNYAVTDAVWYRLLKDGTATVANVSDQISFVDVEGSSAAGATCTCRLLNSGEVVEFTVNVTRTNDGSTDDNGIFQLDPIVSIGWSAADDTTFEGVYEFNLDEFKTDPMSLD